MHWGSLDCVSWVTMRKSFFSRKGLSFQASKAENRHSWPPQLPGSWSHVFSPKSTDYSVTVSLSLRHGLKASSLSWSYTLPPVSITYLSPTPGCELWFKMPLWDPCRQDKVQQNNGHSCCIWKRFSTQFIHVLPFPPRFQGNKSGVTHFILTITCAASVIERRGTWLRQSSDFFHMWIRIWMRCHGPSFHALFTPACWLCDALGGLCQSPCPPQGIWPRITFQYLSLWSK